MVWGFGVSLPMHVSCIGQLPGQLLLFFCEQDGCKLASISCGSSEMRSVHSLELCWAGTVAALGAAFLPSCGTGREVEKPFTCKTELETLRPKSLHLERSVLLLLLGSESLGCRSSLPPLVLQEVALAGASEAQHCGLPATGRRLRKLSVSFIF